MTENQIRRDRKGSTDSHDNGSKTEAILPLTRNLSLHQLIFQANIRQARPVGSDGEMGRGSRRI